MLRRRKKTNMQERPLIVHGDPKAVGSEAFRTLRTNVQFTSPDRELKTILLTSAGPSEGKSTVSGNLAVAFAQSGQRVIVVGCDLRKPVLHQMYSIANAPGLTGHLTGQATLDQAIVSSRIPGLDVLPSGPVPPNPSELLQSKAMDKVITDLKERYDIVVFDGAPVIAVTDAAVMSSKVDGTIIVVRANHVPRDVVVQAKTLLEQANARILGVVLNGVRPQDQKNYHYYYYYHEAE